MIAKKRMEVSSRDFGLRPPRPNLRVIVRPQTPIEHASSTPNPHHEGNQNTKGTNDGPRPPQDPSLQTSNQPSTGQSYNESQQRAVSPHAPKRTRKAKAQIADRKDSIGSQKSNSSEASRKPENVSAPAPKHTGNKIGQRATHQSPTVPHLDNAPDAGSQPRPITPPTPKRSKKNKAHRAGRNSPVASQSNDSADVDSLTQETPWHHALGRDVRDLWRLATKETQSSDESASELDIVNWIMTRKGGVHAAPWPELVEGEKAIQDMRKDTIDLEKIYRRYDEEEEERKRKEERRLANKFRYRSRSEWAKDAATRRAAAVAAKIAESQPLMEQGESRDTRNDDPWNKRRGDEGDYRRKRCKVDATDN